MLSSSIIIGSLFGWFFHTSEPVSLRPEPVANAYSITGPQSTRWQSAKLNTRDLVRLDQMVALYTRNRAIYEKIETMRSNGVPAPVICGFHMRESDNDFKAHLHEGSSLQHRTRFVPIGRLPAPAQPPFTFLQSAEDALYVYEKLETKDWSHLESGISAVESYNGLGYRRIGVASPYVWAGTTIYSRGKYVADGRYSATAVDQQLGVASVLLRMKERGIAIAFAP